MRSSATQRTYLRNHMQAGREQSTPSYGLETSTAIFTHISRASHSAINISQGPSSRMRSEIFSDGASHDDAWNSWIEERVQEVNWGNRKSKDSRTERFPRRTALTAQAFVGWRCKCQKATTTVRFITCAVGGHQCLAGGGRPGAFLPDRSALPKEVLREGKRRPTITRRTSDGAACR